MGKSNREESGQFINEKLHKVVIKTSHYAEFPEIPYIVGWKNSEQLTIRTIWSSYWWQIEGVLERSEDIYKSFDPQDASK